MIKRSIPLHRVFPQTALLLVVLIGASLRNRGIHTPLVPELPGLCPLGALQALVGLDWSKIAIPGGVILATLLLGPVFCGSFCPLGTIQEWTGRLGRRIIARPTPSSRGALSSRGGALPPKLRRLGGNFGLAVLALMVLASAPVPGNPFLFDLDRINPSPAFIHVWTRGAAPAALIILLILLGASLFTDRPWCRWICPYGALLGLIGTISPVTVRRVQSSCVNCTRCDRACPAGIAPSLTETLRDRRCNRCESCLQACPVQETLMIATPLPRKKAERTTPGASPLRRPLVKISGWTMTILATIIIFAPLAATGAGRIPADTSSTHREGSPLSPEEISPVMTLEELARRSGKEPEALLLFLGLPEDLDITLMLIDLEDEPDLEKFTLGYIRSIFTDPSPETHGGPTGRNDTYLITE
ncbi:hypothetical protein AU468_12875 [Alkalispirochaeta sphaeroplastigenens]|uniref:4Fe-4S ferredoxin-type domain-containing protein n=1 Tax=Alkalispirochaeta sphaeroplastigenens TaxID=1187066 RepID=A0A2S4JGD9_9SPIO|nr:4Fe-4S binding protein [Alkalispirochaeta sphaeroplastigenens]POQ98480.1 hypothetical protein AU468_12875 [Alkalispirochaeta sphaeroplastigenens]